MSVGGAELELELGNGSGRAAGESWHDPIVTEHIADKVVDQLVTAVALGVFGVIGFMFIWGLKIFKLLPTEARAGRQPTVAQAH